MTLKELLERITHGNVQDEYLRLLAARLSRIYNKCKAPNATNLQGWRKLI